MQDLDVIFRGHETSVDKSEFLERLQSLKVRQICMKSKLHAQCLLWVCLSALVGHDCQ